MISHLDRVRQRQSDGEWKSFGNGHYQDGNTDNQVPNELAGIFALPLLVVQYKRFYTKLNDQYEHGEHSDSRSCNNGDNAIV